MKKVQTLALLLTISLATFAQKSNIQSAVNYLKENDIANAKKMIDEALNNESTKNSAKAWLLKGVIYQAIGTPSELMPELNFILNETPYKLDLASANSLKGSVPNAIAQSVEAYSKSMSLDSKYEKSELLPLLSTLVGLGFNNGITQMNDSKFADAMETFAQVSALKKLDGGKPWSGIPQMDTVFANAKLYQANCAYQLNKEEEALPLLEETMNSPYISNADVYIMAADVYERKANDAKWNETMKAAKAKFPNDKRILNNEINYYLKTGKGEQAIAKLKEGIAAEPNKVDLHLNLGQLYYTMANPTDKSGKLLSKPANAKDLEKDAMTCYTKAVELDPKNAYAQFYNGLYYYNKAKEVTDEMNKADDKKYEAMKPERDGIIAKAIPFLDKAKSIIESEGVNDANREMYKQTLSGLAQSYNITGKSDKATAIQNILNGL